MRMKYKAYLNLNNLFTDNCWKRIIVTWVHKVTKVKISIKLKYSHLLKPALFPSGVTAFYPTFWAKRNQLTTSAIILVILIMYFKNFSDCTWIRKSYCSLIECSTTSSPITDWNVVVTWSKTNFSIVSNDWTKCTHFK
jgi:hypothetical protein